MTRDFNDVALGVKFVNEAQELHLSLIVALKAGDVEGVRLSLGDPPEWVNGRDALLHIHVLAYAIDCAPLHFVRMLLNQGADPNYEALDGFPSLLVAQEAERSDRHEVLAMLLAAGADPNQRGNNDYTALHVAAVRNDIRAVALLLRHGADPHAWTRIDELETPLEVATRAGAYAAATSLEAAGATRRES